MPIDLEKLLQMVNEPPEPEAEPERTLLQVPIDELVDFPADKHRFRPAVGQRLKELEDSIRLNGILNPLLIRILPDGAKQILAGHNRRTAARNIGYRTVDCIVKDVSSDDEALLIVIHDNIHGRELLPSERGWAYRDYMEIRRRQGYRSDLTSCKSGTRFRTDEVIAKDTTSSARQVQRYIRLTYLIDPLLELVDRGKIGLGTGEQLSFLSRYSQQIVFDYCYASDPGHPLKEAHAKALREAEADPDRIVDEDLLEELTAKKQTARLRTLKLEMSQLRDYFPAGTPEEVVKQTIHTALAIYFENGREEN